MHRLPLDRNDFIPLPAAVPLGPGLSQRAGQTAAGDGVAQAAHSIDELRASVYPMAPEVIDMESELGYWRGHYRGLPGGSALRYGDYEPAVKLGMDAFMRSRGRGIDDMEDELEACYRRTRGLSRLDWQQARAVVRLAWNHLHLRGLKA
ncbi:MULTISPECIES: hypothetical protein [Lysobacter]|uniref:Uncharacterized protein n=1 Tax=Lysobacter yananisis TaxID=1003114 RepID=A0ABY9PI06_9GAMM|nr:MULTISPECIES: hypothetical protein [Lysobacter]QQQ02772.1 hypothetical protein JHW41_07320 [Lysobacter enzymogenes]WMT05710.1 hypothetical protein RDV84_12965 [Lysobacter yananisis]